jgi:serine/threonine-protein kinase
VGRRLELPVQLITEAVYEKAARGVDGRAFPWGDTFDPALCKSVHSRPGTPRPESVGAFPTDTSVYGVRDLAGGMRTWCADPHFDGDPALRPMRGGYWGADHRLCRAANRYGMEPDAARPGLGLRLMIPVHP